MKSLNLNLLVKVVVTPIVLAMFYSMTVQLWSGIELQQAAKGFAQVQGEVTRSEHQRGNDSYTSSIEFTYRFADRAWTKVRKQNDDLESAAEARVKAHPVGMKVPLLVNPANPAEVLLPAEARGVPVWVLFLPLLDLAAVLFTLGGLLDLYARWAWAETGGVRLARSTRETRVHLRAPLLEAVQTGGPLLAVPAFAWWVSQIVGFAPDAESPAMLMSGFGLLLGPVLVWRLATRPGHITLQSTSRMLVLPGAGEDHGELHVSFAEVEAVTVAKDEDSESSWFAVSVRPRGRDATELKRWSDEEGAQRFAGWLRQQLDLAPSPAP